MRPAAAPGRVADAWPAWLRGWRADAVIAFAAGASELVGTYLAGRNQTDRASMDALAYALLAAGPVALLVRRRYPVAVLLVVFGTTLAYWTIDYPRGPVFIALIVAFITTVIAGYRAVAIIMLIAGWTAFTFLPYLAGTDSRPGLAGPFALLAWLLVLLGVGEVARAGRARAAETARTREEEARRRASEERLRIARELHDVLAHNISLINVQAGVALHLMDEQPEQARTALTAIKQASKDALGELRSVLEVLRRSDEAEPRTPQPGLDELDDLISRAGAAG
ncbi:MAG: histidine kinase dimerization/phosphoacceptor domain-containing protein, partial [Acidimicrobiia bacterium]